MDGEPIFFAAPDDFRQWLEANHDKLTEQWVGFYKKATDIPSITWPESVDQALCFGWIDGIRRSIDDKSYKIRFTPRKPNSHWSKVNIEKVKQLKKAGLMKEAGLKLYKKRNLNKIAQASYERGIMKLDPHYEKQLRDNKKAWEDFNHRPASYKKRCIVWIMGAKQEETRRRRLKILVECSEAHEKIPPLRLGKN